MAPGAPAALVRPRAAPYIPRSDFRAASDRGRAFQHGRLRMPIPTDTFRNIRRLNWIFAATSLLLLLLMVASVMQDYYKSWRRPQQNGAVWQAALVDDKVNRALTPEMKKRLDELSKEIADADKAASAHKAESDKLRAQIATIRSGISTLEFGLNNRKATLAVQEAELEQARTAAVTPEDK